MQYARVNPELWPCRPSSQSSSNYGHGGKWDAPSQVRSLHNSLQAFYEPGPNGIEVGTLS